MTLAVFNPAQAGYLAIDLDHQSEDDLPVLVQRFAGQGKEVRAAVQDIGRRLYRVTLGCTKAESKLVDEFWRLRAYQVTSVLFTDPRLATRTGVSLGTSVAAQVLFTLPTTGENSRDYPQAPKSGCVVYDDGVAATISTMSTDSRTFTLSAAPTAGSIMTCDYPFYRRVRLVGTYAWTGRAPDYFSTQLTLQEVVE